MPYQDTYADDDLMADFDGGYAVEPFTPQPEAASQVEPDITYERDIAPGARQLFDNIEADTGMSWRRKAQLQQGLLQGVGDLVMQREKLEGVRMQKEMNRMRMERERFALDDVRNRRAQVQANQARAGEIGQKLQGVLGLPMAEREAALNELVAQDFDVISNSPSMGRQIDAIRRTTRAQGGGSYEDLVGDDKPFKTPSDLRDFVAANADNEAAIEALNTGDPIKIGLAAGTGSIIRGYIREARQTAEQEARAAYTKRAEVIRDLAPKIDTFVLDFEETEEMRDRRVSQATASGIPPAYKPQYMSEATHIRAKRAVDQLGSDEDKRAWDEADGSPERDRIRVQIARNAILRAENELLRRESNNPQSVGAGLVDLPGR